MVRGGCPSIPSTDLFGASKKNKTLCLPVIDHGDAVKVPTGNDESSRVRAVWNSGINQKLLIGYRRGRAREVYAGVYEDKLRDFGVTLRRRIN